MAVGKYSPTVSEAYLNDRGWWKPGDDGIYDAEGFDSYGYNKDDIDRAGNHEHDYMCGEEVPAYNRETDSYSDTEWAYPLYEQVLSEWTVDKVTGKPVRKK